ncbi:MAG: TonB-dependent receptor, partial [Bacteroidota bacterium]|nr:TonB-dependent receptor [Bacteroidota bacterium]
SSDSLSYKGSMDFTGVFVQDEMKYFSNRLHITMGLRADIARFYNGSLRIENPTNITGFTENSFTEFDNNTWLALSPKLAARYKLIEKLSAYASVASGFMPPKLNDLCQSGKIRKGFKLANPDLGPKTLWNYEIGMDYSPAENLKIASSMYYSHGYNFHNLVGTGDSIDTGGTDLKPVLRKLNISEIEIRGIELFFNWKINRHFRFLTNYAYAKSTILDFDKNNDSDEINGNYIIEVPPHTLYAGLFYSGKLFDASLDYSYTDAIWADIQNTQEVEPYDIWNFKISRNFAKHWNMGITLQNFFDNEFIDRKGRKSPGRFNMVEISYRW